MDITCLVYSFGVLNRLACMPKYRQENEIHWDRGMDPAFVHQLAMEAVHPVRLENYSYSMLVNILYGLSLLRFNDPEVLNRILNVITRDDILQRYPAIEKEYSFWVFRLDIQNISAAVYAIGYLKFWSLEATTKLLKEATHHLADFPSYGIASMLWSLGNLRYPNLEIVKQIAETAAEERHLRNYQEQDLTSVLYGLAMCKYRHPAVVGVLITEIMRPGRLTQMQDVCLK